MVESSPAQRRKKRRVSYSPKLGGGLWSPYRDGNEYIVEHPRPLAVWRVVLGRALHALSVVLSKLAGTLARLASLATSIATAILVSEDGGES